MERLAALFSPRRSKRFVVVQSDKREILKILMKRTRVETESDENKRVDKESLFWSSFSSVLPSFFFQRSYLNFVAPVLRCSRFFFHFFSSFFLLFSFSLVCVVRQSLKSPELKLFFLSFFLSERVFLKNEREERERKQNRNLRLLLGFFGVDSQNGKSEREREILLLCSRKRRRQTRE